MIVQLLVAVFPSVIWLIQFHRVTLSMAMISMENL